MHKFLYTYLIVASAICNGMDQPAPLIDIEDLGPALRNAHENPYANVIREHMRNRGNNVPQYGVYKDHGVQQIGLHKGKPSGPHGLSKYRCLR